jgi:hypothetical protein
MAIIFLQGMTRMVGLTINVRDTTPGFTISVEQDNIELVTLYYTILV